MNRRQKKKAFKKRFGFNPPKGISIKTATRIMKYKENIIAIFERLKAAIFNLWEQVKQPALELAGKWRRQCNTIDDLKLLLRQQESEAKRIESDIDVHNHDRR